MEEKSEEGLGQTEIIFNFESIIIIISIVTIIAVKPNSVKKVDILKYQPF